MVLWILKEIQFQIWRMPSLEFGYSRRNIPSVKQSVIIQVHTVSIVETNNSLRKLPLPPREIRKKLLSESVWVPHHIPLKGTAESSMRNRGGDLGARFVSHSRSDRLGLPVLRCRASASRLRHIVSPCCHLFNNSFFVLAFQIIFFPLRYKSIVCRIIS